MKIGHLNFIRKIESHDFCIKLNYSAIRKNSNKEEIDDGVKHRSFKDMINHRREREKAERILRNRVN